jgi:hypothetical protein
LDAQHQVNNNTLVAFVRALTISSSANTYQYTIIFKDRGYLQSLEIGCALEQYQQRWPFLSYTLLSVELYASVIDQVKL